MNKHVIEQALMEAKKSLSAYVKCKHCDYPYPQHLIVEGRINDALKELYRSNC
jgi:hypothetical protein